MRIFVIPLWFISIFVCSCNSNQSDTISHAITSVVPHQLQRNTVRMLELTIDNMPLLGDSLVCVFTTTAEEPSIFTNATISPTGVMCPSPSTELLTKIAPGKHDFTAQLSVRTIDGLDLGSTSFTFFDCSTHLSCTQCVTSQYPCDWCIDDDRCTNDPAENCRNDTVITGVSRGGPSYRSGPSSCPRMEAGIGGSEILVASGTRKALKVKARVVGHFIAQTRFVCQFKIDGHLTGVDAQLLGDTIYCSAMEFVNTSKSPNLTATFDVIWGESRPLDNPDNIRVVIYRCSDLSDNCEKPSPAN